MGMNLQFARNFNPPIDNKKLFAVGVGSIVISSAVLVRRRLKARTRRREAERSNSLWNPALGY
jgi:hypothetical protein